jgi:hydrogenase nickel incorporation protein HypB
MTTARVAMEGKVLSENQRIAAALRERFAASGLLCLNFVSSPGAGKTSLLERTLEAFHSGERVAMLTGDIQTDNDAVRLGRYGFPVRQITTGGACHLDARMIENGLSGWNVEQLDYLLIENVGNLVCPSSFDLGEAAKVVVLSVPEGDDKPLKYPSIFLKYELLVVNKIDLAQYVSFSIPLAEENARRVHPDIEIIEVSCTTSEGLDRWMVWLRQRREAVRPVTANA